MTWILAIWIFCLGAAVGSFTNVLIYRLPRQESIAFPGSHCPACGTPILWHDNIPLASFLFLGGRCRSCRGRISPRYPLVEALCALLFLALYLRFGLSARSAVLAVFCTLLVAATFIDLDHFVIPDRITFPGMAAGFAASFLPEGPGPAMSALGILLGYGALFLVAWAYFLVTRREGMGMGDFKLLGMIGAFLGVISLPLTLLVSSLAGSAVGLAAMAVKRRGPTLAVPYGPFLALGALVHLFFGSRLIAWYLGMAG